MVLSIIGWVIITIGVLFSFLGGLGVIRMPDIFNRIQAGTKASTLGLISVAIGGIFCYPEAWFKFVFIALFVVATNPISSHNLARASYHKMKEDGETPMLEVDMMEKGGTE